MSGCKSLLAQQNYREIKTASLSPTHQSWSMHCVRGEQGGAFFLYTRCDLHSAGTGRRINMKRQSLWSKSHLKAVTAKCKRSIISHVSASRRHRGSSDSMKVTASWRGPHACWVYIHLAVCRMHNCRDRRMLRFSTHLHGASFAYISTYLFIFSRHFWTNNFSTS